MRIVGKTEMNHNFTAPALVKWHLDEEEEPEDWAGAIAFPTLHHALEALVSGTPQTGHPWVRSAGRVYAPHEVEELCREDHML